MKSALIVVLCLAAGCSPPVEPRGPVPAPVSPLNPDGPGPVDVAVLPEQFVRIGVQEQIFLRPGLGGVRALAFSSTNDEQPVDGVEVGADSVTVLFTAKVRGRIQLRVVNAASQLVIVVPLYAVKAIDETNDFTRTYVDRMDTCSEGPFRAKPGRVFCRRNEDIWVYRDDGSIDGHFKGDQLAVVGDEIWTADGLGYEHRTDLGAGGLRLDGRVDAQIALPWGETQPGVALRGVKSGLVELRWDGRVLTARSLSGFPDLERYALALRLTDDRPVLASEQAVCTVTRGCQQTTCPSFFSCASTVGFGVLLGVTRTDIWQTAFDPTNVDGFGNAFGSIGLLQRTTRDRARTERFTGPDGMSAGLWRTIVLDTGRGPELRAVMSSAPVLTSTQGRGSVFPDSDASGGFLWWWNHRGTLLGANDDFFIVGRTPFELVFHPR